MKFRIETVDFRQAKDIYGERRARQAMANSMNGVIGKAKNVMVDEVLKEYVVRRKDVKERSILFRRAFPQKLEAWLIGIGARIRVGAFGRPRQGQAGTSVTIKRGERTLYPSAFMATVTARKRDGTPAKRGHKGVWWRVSKKRLPIYEPLGPSVAHMYVNNDVQREVVRYVQRELPVDFSIRLLESARRKIRSAQKRIIP